MAMTPLLTASDVVTRRSLTMAGRYTLERRSGPARHRHLDDVRCTLPDGHPGGCLHAERGHDRRRAPEQGDDR